MILYYHKLIYLLPLALITGPFLPDLIVVLCSLLFLIDTFRLKLFKYYNNYFFKIFIIFFILINLSSLFAEYYNSFKYSIGYIRYGIFSIFLYYVLLNFKNFKFNFSVVFFSTFMVVIIDGYVQYFFGKNIFLIELQKYQSDLYYVTSFFGEEKKLGSYLSRLAPIFFISILMIEDKFKLKVSYLNSIIILILLILVLLTTERVSIFLTGSLFIFILFKSKYLITSKKFFFVIGASLIFLVFYHSPNLLEKMKSILYSSGILFPGWNEVGAPGKGGVIGGYDLGTFYFSKFHQDQVINSFNIFKESPFLGVGAKNFKLFVTNGWHPHNFHGQVLAELGIFSYLLFFLTFIFLLVKSIKIFFFEKHNSLEEELKNYLYIIILLNFLPIPSGDFFNNWLNILIYLPFGFLLFLNEKKI